MKQRLAFVVSTGVLSLACAALAGPQTFSLGGGGPPSTPPGVVAPSAGPKIPAVDPATLQDLPSSRDYKAPEGVIFKSQDFTSENVRLTAQWFYAFGSDDRTLPTVIMAPGWGATAASLRADAADLARAGYLVLLFDYRGWGESDGRMIRDGAAGVKELRGYIDPFEQVEDWFNAISFATTNPMVNDGRIGIRGSDLAGGHVVHVAANDPRVKALVSQVSSVDTRPYKPWQPDPEKITLDAHAAASSIAAGQAQYPAERARTVDARGGAQVGAGVGNKLIRWAPVRVADQVETPSLFVLVEDEELFANANNGQLACDLVMGPRKLMMIGKTTHYAIYGQERERAINLSIDWFDRHLKAPGSPTRVPINDKEPERGECFPPPIPPSGEEEPVGAGDAFKVMDTTGRFN